MKLFHISDVLSVTTPFLLSERHVGGVYDILGFLCGEQLFTHQLSRVNREVRPWLQAQYPQLMDDHSSMVTLIQRFQDEIEVCADRSVCCRAFIEEVRISHRLPEMLPLEPMGRDMHTSINPVEESRAMVGDDKVVVVESH